MTTSQVTQALNINKKQSSNQPDAAQNMPETMFLRQKRSEAKSIKRRKKDIKSIEMREGKLGMRMVAQEDMKIESVATGGKSHKHHIIKACRSLLNGPYGPRGTSRCAPDTPTGLANAS